MIGIIDYGVGNLFSLTSSLKSLGQEVVVTRDEKEIASADRLILPGVGAFKDAADKLRETGMEEVVKREAEKGKYLLGICLGMQLLFDESAEYGITEGLHLIDGRIVPIRDAWKDADPGLKIPQMGWNSLRLYHDHPLFSGIREGAFVYFVHSFYAQTAPAYVIADTEYGAPVTAAAAKDNVLGCQFHPEKSGKVGLAILDAFCNLK